MYLYYGCDSGVWIWMYVAVLTNIYYCNVWNDNMLVILRNIITVNVLKWYCGSGKTLVLQYGILRIVNCVLVLTNWSWEYDRVVHKSPYLFNFVYCTKCLKHTPPHRRNPKAIFEQTALKNLWSLNYDINNRKYTYIASSKSGLLRIVVNGSLDESSRMSDKNY